MQRQQTKAEELLQEISNESQNQEVKEVISVLDNLSGTVEKIIEAFEKRKIVDFKKNDNKVPKD